MLKALRKNKFHKAIASFLLVNFIAQIVMPLQAFALTSGPSQPEIQSFEPVGTNQMVDPFTGDFTYNIPLFNLPGPNGGYPFNMAYHSGIGMEQEASWVGLGWNINVGSINRQKRNLPDEFDGSDKITLTQGMKPNWTIGVGGQKDIEIIGVEKDKLGKIISNGNATLSIAYSVFYNNYRGLGQNFGIGLSSMDSKTNSSALNAGIMINFNSQDGIGINPSLSISTKKGNADKAFNGSLGISTGYNSRQGLYDLSLTSSVTSSRKNIVKKTSKKTKEHKRGSFYAVGASLGFAGASGSPSVGNPYRGYSLNLKFKNGINFPATLVTHQFEAYYNHQVGLYNYAAHDYPAVGYMHLEKANDGSVKDMSSLNEGMLYKNSKRLPIPVLNYDIYTVTGQGFAGMFRPFRNEVVLGSPRRALSNSGGLRLGLEIGPGPTPNIGINVGGNYSRTVESKWGEGDFENRLSSDKSGSFYEPYYFKAYGEMAATEMEDNPQSLNPFNQFINSEEARSFRLSTTGVYINKDYEAIPELESNWGSESTVFRVGDEPNYSNRRPRGTDIRAITVGELINWDATDGNSYDMIPEYYTEYYNGQYNDYALDKNFNKNSLLPYQHKDKSEHANHVAMYVATSPDGQRYVYGLPAYNNKEIERVVSVQPQGSCDKKTSVPSGKPTKGDKYLMEQETPAYPYAHLLTAVLGADYVDADDIPGPSDGDFGYWVKFTYAKMHDNYKWRAPFFGGNYMKGLETNVNDDKVAYARGEKEIWYLATAETATHLAEFNLSRRLDAVGASEETVASDVSKDYRSNDNSRTSYRLKSVALFSKKERYNDYGVRNDNAIPIQTTHFDYNYKLCPGIDNRATSTNAGGKLALKKLWFTYKNNNRGALSQYTFDYREVDENDNPTAYNPSYNESNVDRWGNYKSATSSCVIDAPYVDQYADKDIHNQNASAWHLHEIGLPSGGKITVDYEADRYAYVQDQVAMQMTPIVGIKQDGNNAISMDRLSESGSEYRRVYFDLEHHVPSGTASSYLQRYIAPGEDLYFKTRIQIRNTTYETIGGYVGVENIAFDQNSITNGNYTKAYVELKSLDVNGKTVDYHPFSVSAWNYLRISNPDYIYNYGDNNNTTNETVLALEDIRAKASGLLSIRQSLVEMVKGFYDFMAGKDWGNSIDLQNSFIRLRTPDKEKIGGGTRVRKITLSNEWDTATENQEKTSEYGQVYDYTMVEEEGGEIISSGVAEYEPLIGGDEIALRKPVRYHHNIPLKTNLGLYSEDPINEELYPSASVGYRKVSVMSLASYYASLKPGDDDYANLKTQQYQNIVSMTGKTEHEFYTAKEFPVRTHVTELYDRDEGCTMCTYRAYMPIPLVGAYQRNIMAATQGYSIALNDMHGKQKKIAQYAQDKDGNFITSAPVSSVEYFYNRADNIKNTGDISSEVDVLFSDDDPDDETRAHIEKRDLGKESEMWVETKQARTDNYSGGLDFNTEIFIFFPWLYLWPSYSQSVNIVKTVVNNKVIHKSGILVKTRVQNGESVVITENKCFDPLTGEPLLTTVTNDFEDPVYTYQMPARWSYEGMGAAYEMNGAEFKVNYRGVGYSGTKFEPNDINSLGVAAKLTPGAKVVVLGEDLYLEFIEQKDDLFVFTNVNGVSGFPQVLTNVTLTLKVIKPVKTNQLQEKSGEIVALEDPTKLREYEELNEIKVINEDYLKLLNRAKDNGVFNQLEDSEKYYLRDSEDECEILRQAGNVCYSDLPSLKRWIKTPNSNLDYVLFRDGCYVAQFVDNCLSCKGISGEGVPTYCWALELYELGDNTYNTTATGIHSKYNSGGFSYTEKNLLNIEQVSSTELKFNYTDNSSSSYCLDRGNYNKYKYSEAIPFRKIKRNGKILNAYSNTYLRSDQNNWNLKEGRVYNSERSIYSSINLSANGVFVDDDFRFFELNEKFLMNNEFKHFPVQNKGKEWQLTNEITEYNDHGMVAEEKDALGIYSAALYGHNEQFVIATANNAQKEDIYYDNIEEIWYESYGHTGQKSWIQNFSTQYWPLNDFVPKAGNTYHVSGWINLYENMIQTPIKHAEHYYQEFNQAAAKLVVVDQDGLEVGTQQMNLTGVAIDGWQKVEADITIPAGTDLAMRFIFENTDGIGKFMMDDLRAHPAGAIMKSYVYNTNDWTLAATLDENNYATFYYYDDQGKLFQVKSETERGIQTVKETRMHSSQK